MRTFKEKLFPVAALAGALLVLVLMLRVLVIDPDDVLTGPPDLYITADGDPFFVQESCYDWVAYQGYKRSVRARKDQESFPSSDDKIVTTAEDILLDFDKYAPTYITVTYASTLTGEKSSVSVENNKFKLLPGTYYYFVNAEWGEETPSYAYAGTAKYNLLVTHKK